MFHLLKHASTLQCNEQTDRLAEMDKDLDRQIGRQMMEK